MNREIKFRGKRIDNGEWVIGSLVMVCDGESFRRYPCIVISFNHYTFDWHEVLPETIGQFTGLTDKNGVKIFEGDHVQHDAWGYPFEIIFNQDKARFVCRLKTGITQYIHYEGLIVIGNIHDNPELLK